MTTEQSSGSNNIWKTPKKTENQPVKRNESEDSEHFSFFVSCPKSFEELLADELLGFGALNCKVTSSGVQAKGDIELAYKTCLLSRIANRVLFPLLESDQSDLIDNDYDLYSSVYSLAWEAHIPPNSTLVVDFNGTNQAINNSQFGAMRVKDAIVDRLQEKTGTRPDVDKNQPDFRINVRLHRNRIGVSLDLSGDSLHRRGYRTEQGAAPLKENVAAALLMRAGWPELSDGSLIDPMCGSGTFLIEGALMALGLAPGIFRERFGFERWLKHHAQTWHSLLEAEQAKKASADLHGRVRFWGFDENPRVLEKARANINKAQLEGLIQLERKSLKDFKKPESADDKGLIICNPPYGERLGDVEALRETYQELGLVAKSQCAGWRLAVLSSNEDLVREMRLRPKRKNRFLNGAIPSLLLSYDLLSADKAKLRVDPEDSDELSEGAQMVANRLSKNLKRLEKWLPKAQTNAYRVYDADMPEYAAAVDVYGSKLHIQEYAPPKSIDERAANRRLREFMRAVETVFKVEKDQMFLKVRKPNKGKDQYQKLDSRGNFHEQVEEGKARFWVNLSDYLDTGLFLDHRLLRLKIAKSVAGKSFLNLFCYTASASVHAALGGATETTSVDMSKTYLDWARHNFELNRMNLSRHELVLDDCFNWLRNCRKGYDVIMLDPPTFSNSKKMDGVLDVQKDHVQLVSRCMELLKPGGVLYFSNNLRSFKLDPILEEKFSVKNMTPETIDEDFARNKKIHHCFELRSL